MKRAGQEANSATMQIHS